MKIKRTSGYSETLAKMYIPSDVSTYSLSINLDTQVKWVNGRPKEQSRLRLNSLIRLAYHLCLPKLNFKILRLVRLETTYISKPMGLR